jgi:hypothetical protein
MVVPRPLREYDQNGHATPPGGYYKDAVSSMTEEDIVAVLIDFIMEDPETWKIFAERWGQVDIRRLMLAIAYGYKFKYAESWSTGGLFEGDLCVEEDGREVVIDTHYGPFGLLYETTAEQRAEALHEFLWETTLTAPPTDDPGTLQPGDQETAYDQDRNQHQAYAAAGSLAVDVSQKPAKVVAGAVLAELRLAAAAGHAEASFGGVVANTADEAAFLRNAAATFAESRLFTSAARFEGSIVVRRSDIPWSVENVRLMAKGCAPYVRNSKGAWERIHLHHVGRQNGKRIEVLQSYNRYDHATGGPLHIAGSGGPLRDPNFAKLYWQQRLRDAISAGVVPRPVLSEAGLVVR